MICCLSTKTSASSAARDRNKSKINPTISLNRSHIQRRIVRFSTDCQPDQIYDRDNGALSVASGRVDLKWSHEADGHLQLRWTETGGPKVQTPTHKGLGSRIIEQMITQHSGQVSFDWHTEGLVCAISLKA
jgi:hypothetical protein